MLNLNNLTIKKLILFTPFFGLFFLASCAARQVTICCEPQRANIYIDGQLVGQGIVRYNIPRKLKTIEISCGENGIIYTSRKFHTKGIGPIINIYLDEYKYYSSDPNTLSTH